MAERALEIEDLPGVGPSTADKLREAGYLSVESIATASPAELSEISEISESVAKKIVKAAREAADIGGFKTGKDIFEQRKDIRKLSFRVPELDALMGGGLKIREGLTGVPSTLIPKTPSVPSVSSRWCTGWGLIMRIRRSF